MSVSMPALRRGGVRGNPFVAYFLNRLDAKGRISKGNISISASFRAVLTRDGVEGLCIHPWLDIQSPRSHGGGK